MKRNPKFRVGDKVTHHNGQGCVFPDKTIVGVQRNEVRGWTYFIEPTDTPWYDHSEGDFQPA